MSTSANEPKWPTDRGEPIPEDRLLRNSPTPTCRACGGINHIGWCDEMRADFDQAVKTGGGRPVPLTRC